MCSGIQAQQHNNSWNKLCIKGKAIWACWRLVSVFMRLGLNTCTCTYAKKFPRVDCPHLYIFKCESGPSYSRKYGDIVSLYSYLLTINSLLKWDNLLNMLWKVKMKNNFVPKGRLLHCKILSALFEFSRDSCKNSFVCVIFRPSWVRNDVACMNKFY